MMSGIEGLTPGERREETPQSMQFRLESQLTVLAATTGINVESLRKSTSSKATGINNLGATNKDETAEN